MAEKLDFDETDLQLGGLNCNKTAKRNSFAILHSLSSGGLGFQVGT